VEYRFESLDSWAVESIANEPEKARSWLKLAAAFTKKFALVHITGRLIYPDMTLTRQVLTSLAITGVLSADIAGAAITSRPDIDYTLLDAWADSKAGSMVKAQREMWRAQGGDAMLEPIEDEQPEEDEGEEIDLL
jgi:hypothetical protein